LVSQLCYGKRYLVWLALEADYLMWNVPVTIGTENPNTRVFAHVSYPIGYVVVIQCFVFFFFVLSDIVVTGIGWQQYIDNYKSCSTSDFISRISSRIEAGYSRGLTTPIEGALNRMKSLHGERWRSPVNPHLWSSSWSALTSLSILLEDGLYLYHPSMLSSLYDTRSTPSTYIDAATIGP
jgi:hypothetical protein